MTPNELLQIELPNLREEMLEVKKCQHQVFIFELIATGAILSFILSYSLNILTKIQFWPLLFFLAPMIIIIPSQYLILDKGITINRICSYFKVLEDYVASSKSYPVPWEIGCSDFREKINKLRPAGSPNPTQGPNSFYKLSYVTTAIITAILFFLVVIYYIYSNDSKELILQNIVILGSIIAAIVVTLVHQLIWLINILSGKFTIMAMAQLWEKIFEEYNGRFSKPKKIP